MAPKSHKKRVTRNLTAIEVEDDNDDDIITHSTPSQPKALAKNIIISTHYESLPSGRLSSRSEILHVEGLDAELTKQPANNGPSNDSFLGMDHETWGAADFSSESENENAENVVHISKKKRPPVESNYVFFFVFLCT